MNVISVFTAPSSVDKYQQINIKFYFKIQIDYYRKIIW